MVSGGEPTLWDNLSSFLHHLANKEYLCFLDINGTMLPTSVLEVLVNTDVVPRISLDSIYEHEHNKNRGEFTKTISNISLLLEMNVPLRITTVLSKTNINSLSSLAEWIAKKGIKKWHICKVLNFSAPDELRITDNESHLATYNVINEYGDDIDIILCNSSDSIDSYSSFVIDGEGNCFTTESNENTVGIKVQFGNIYENSISDIWLNTPLNYRRCHYMKYLLHANTSVRISK